jgi:hypothetical protein
MRGWKFPSLTEQVGEHTWAVRRHVLGYEDRRRKVRWQPRDKLTQRVNAAQRGTITNRRPFIGTFSGSGLRIDLIA